MLQILRGILIRKVGGRNACTNEQSYLVNIFENFTVYKKM